MHASFISQVFTCCWHEEEKRAKALKVIFSYVEIRGFVLSHIEMIVMSKVPFRIKCVCAELGME